MKTLSALISAASILAASNVTFAGNTLHDIPGSACASYNNAQANLLTRDHARIFLPATSPTALWIVCPIQSVAEDMAATVDAPEGYLNVYFDEQVATGTAVTCILRNFSYNTTHFPGRAGTPSPDATFVAVATKTAATADAEALDEYFLFSQDYDEYDYYTVTCKLEPGTGLNSIDIRQR